MVLHPQPGHRTSLYRDPSAKSTPTPQAWAMGLHYTGTLPLDMFELVHYKARTDGSGRFASYWNAFLLFVVTGAITRLKTRMIHSGEVGDIFNIYGLKIMWRSRPFGVKVARKAWSNSRALLHKVIILTQEQYRTEIIVNSWIFLGEKITIDIW